MAGFLAGLGGTLLSSILGGAAGGIAGATDQTTSTNSSSKNSTGSDTNYFQTLQNILNSLQQTQQSQQGSNTSSTSINLSPEAQALQTKLAGKYSSLADSAPNLSGYSANQQEGINRNSGLQSQAVNNVLAARGLSTSPVAGTANANIEAGRVGQITQLQQSLPLLQNQLQLSNLGAASQFFSSIPHGTTTSGTSSLTGDTNTSNQQVSNQTGQGSQGTYAYNNTNSSGSSTKQGSTGAGVAGGLAGLLAGLFG